MPQITVCCLFYGDHPELARRLLRSLRDSLQPGAPVCDFRFALNQACPETRTVVEEWLTWAAEALGVPGRLFSSSVNRFKYPVMRRMFRQPDRPLAEHVMWFDDDSYLDGAGVDWWRHVTSAVSGAGMIGEAWWFPYPENRRRFLSRFPWFDPDRPVRLNAGKPGTLFIQGAWWVLRSDLIQRLDWPIPELRHNGGDSILGEALWHLKETVREFSRNVRVNGGKSGGRSLSPRRGHSERPLGFHDSHLTQPPGLEHHAFTLVTKDFNPPAGVVSCPTQSPNPASSSG